MLQTLPAPPTRTARPRPRSSIRLESRVRQSLCHSPYRHLRAVGLHCDGGTLLLTGILPSYFLKQMAQETVKRVSGVIGIDNQVEVIYVEQTAS